MNNEEIMVTEEVMDVVAEPTRKTGKFFGVVAGAAGVALLTLLGIKLWKKCKAVKAEKEATYTMKDFDDMVNDEL